MAILHTGVDAPDFELTAHDSSRVKLSELLKSGKRVVLTFHPASFTGG